MFEILKSLFEIKKIKQIKSQDWKQIDQVSETVNKTDKIEIETRQHKFNYERKCSSRYNMYSHDIYTKYF